MAERLLTAVAHLTAVSLRSVPESDASSSAGGGLDASLESSLTARRFLRPNNRLWVTSKQSTYQQNITRCHIVITAEISFNYVFHTAIDAAVWKKMCERLEDGWGTNYGDYPRPRVADRVTPSRVDKRVAPDREGAADKQCQGEGKLWSQYVITNREEGKGKPPRLFPKTGYP